MTKTTLSVFLLALISLIGPGKSKGTWIEDGREQDCRSCHRFTTGLSHSLNNRVKAETDLPLRRGRRMGCQTCHDAGAQHGLLGDKRQGTKARDDKSTRVQLRIPRRKLCESCHAPKKGANSSFDHALILAQAHLESRAPRRKEDPGRLDAESRTCLECHDGSVAKAAGHDRTRVGRKMQLEHPVGMKFRRGRKKGSTLRSRGALPRAIRLPGGRVGCGSCHSPFSREDKMLAVTTRQGRLCLACHDL